MADKMADKLKALKKAKVASAKEAADKYESGKWAPTTVKLPEGMKIHRFKKKGNYKVAVIPFRAGKGNPRAKEGYLHYERIIKVHRNVGPKEQDYLCLQENFGEPCPICEDRLRQKRNPGVTHDFLKSLIPKERQLILLWDMKSGEKKVECHEEAVWQGLGSKIDAQVKLMCDEVGEDYASFHLPDKNGYNLLVSVEEKGWANDTGQSGTRNEVTAINFDPRKADLPDEILEQSICLDDCVAAAKLSYDELKELYEQTGSGGGKKGGKGKAAAEEEEEDEEDEEEEEDEKPAKKSSKKDEEEDDEDEDEEEEEDEEPAKKAGKTAKEMGLKIGTKVKHKKYGECEVARISKEGLMITLLDSDGEKQFGIMPADLTIIDEDEDEDEDDEDEDEPKKSTKVTSKKSSPAKKSPGGKSSEEDEDDEDDEDDEEDDESEDEDESEDDDEDEDEEDDEDEDDEEDDEDEDDKPLKPKPKPKVKPKGKK